MYYCFVTAYARYGKVKNYVLYSRITMRLNVDVGRRGGGVMSVPGPPAGLVQAPNQDLVLFFLFCDKAKYPSLLQGIFS